MKKQNCLIGQKKRWVNYSLSKQFLLLFFVICGIYNYTIADELTPIFSYKNYKITIRQCDSLIQLYPDSPTYYTKRGTAYFNKYAYIKAISDFQKAIMLDSSNYYALDLMGGAYYYMDKKDSAFILMNSAFSKDSSCVYQFLIKGNELFEQTDYIGAIPYYSTAIQHDPNFFAAYLNRAYCYTKQKEFEKASQDITAAKNIDPKNIDLKRNSNELHAAIVYEKYNTLAKVILLIIGIIFLIAIVIFFRKRNTSQYFGEEEIN